MSKQKFKRIGRWFISLFEAIYSKTLLQVFLLLLYPVAALIYILIPRNAAYPVFSRFGFVFLKKHYYLPIPDEIELALQRRTNLVGIVIDEEVAFELLEKVVTPYKSEFNAFPVSRSGDSGQFFLQNGGFMAVDGNIYYGLIRHYRPKRIIEIGSGNSTTLAAAAIQQNQRDGATSGELICIEPYPSRMLNYIPEISTLLKKKIQEVDLTLFQSLEAGDILFIDSTHILKLGGDVWWEFCEILPRLKPGVLVHVHDIVLPESCPPVYTKQHLYWNEQYVLQAFLSFNSRFEVIWPGYYLIDKYRERIIAAFQPEYNQMRAKYPQAEPGSFWMRVRDD